MNDDVANRAEFQVKLGRTGLRVSRFGLGTVNIGGRVDEADAFALMDHALASGITLIDTADSYGWRVHQGYTEEVIGRWLARGGHRADVVLATKVGSAMGPGANDRGLSARHIIAGCEESLRRLRTDWIDLYQLHSMDRGTPWDEIWRAMDLLVTQGKIRYVGSSNAAGWDIAAAQEVARHRDAPGLASEQCLYNPLVRHPELEVIPAALAYGMGVLVWSPLHSGLLSGVLRKTEDGTAVKSTQGRAATALDAHRATIVAYEQFCREIGRDPAEVGLAWGLSRPGITSLIIGPRTPAHIDGALRALAKPLTDSELGRLHELFPPIGSGGSGPDAWIV